MKVTTPGRGRQRRRRAHDRPAAPVPGSRVSPRGVRRAVRAASCLPVPISGQASIFAARMAMSSRRPRHTLPAAHTRLSLMPPWPLCQLGWPNSFAGRIESEHTPTASARARFPSTTTMRASTVWEIFARRRPSSARNTSLFLTTLTVTSLLPKCSAASRPDISGRARISSIKR